MSRRFKAVALAFLVTGCSNSASLLKAGDPHVCAQSDVTKQLFAILKQHTANPISDADAAAFGVNPESWLDKISLAIDGVTSTSVDKDNQKVDCNGTVHFTASGVDKETTASVNYEVSSDLSTGKIVVSADTSNSTIGISQMIALVAQPDIEKPLREKADAEKARNDAIMAAENKRGEEFQLQREINDVYAPLTDPFSREAPVPSRLLPEAPCREEEHSGEQACIVIQKYIPQSDFARPTHLELSYAATQTLVGKYNNISLIYDFQKAPGYGNYSPELSFGDESGAPKFAVQNTVTRAWISTRDGGKTWSNVQYKQLATTLPAPQPK